MDQVLCQLGIVGCVLSLNSLLVHALLHYAAQCRLLLHIPLQQPLQPNQGCEGARFQTKTGAC